MVSDGRSADHPGAVRALAGPARTVESFGRQIHFYGRALGSSYRALLFYQKEVVQLVAEVSMGVGALALTGGTVAVVGILSAVAGALVSLQGYDALANIGVEALSGFFSAFVMTRIVAPFIAGVALAATVGAGATAQLGSMRISEEIDALEVMSVRSLPYLVGTRIVAGVIAFLPLYAIGLIGSYVAFKFTVVVLFDQSSGNFDHYFSTFLITTDIFWSIGQVAVMVVVIMLIHTYYGYTASGGPAGVGEAVGRAVRASLIGVVTVQLLVSMAVYGGDGGFNLSG